MSVITDLEADATKVLKFLGAAQKKTLTVGPSVVATVGATLGAAVTAIESAGTAAAAGGLNISLDVATVTAFKAVLPDVKSFLTELGLK